MTTRSSSLALAIVTLTTAAATACAGAPQHCAPAHGLLLPAVAAAETLQLTQQAGHLAIDGIATDAAWGSQPPITFALPDGRYFVYDPYNELGYAWDPATRQLSSFGRVSLLPVVGVGQVVRTADEDASHLTMLHLADVDPDRQHPALRELWRGALGSANVDFPGAIDGAIAVLVRQLAKPPANRATLVCIDGPRHVIAHSFSLPDSLMPVSDDAIRGHDMLVYDGADAIASAPRPFTRTVELLDLDSGVRRSLGRAPGGWTIYTNIPHPYVNVQWSDVDRPVENRWSSEGGPYTIVDIKTFALSFLPTSLLVR